MKGLTTVVSEQNAVLDKLAGDLRDLLEMNGPLSDSDLIQMSKNDAHVTSKQFYTDRSSVRDLFADLSHFALSRFTALADEDKQRLESAVGKLFLNAREGINAIGAESAADNSISQEKLPPLLSRDLRSLPPREFNSIVLKQARRLARSGREELCTDLEREFIQFKCAIHDDTALREELEIQPSIVSFADGWRPLGVRFSKLRQFCVGIATVFPGKSTVESDFSVINWEYDEFRGSLTEFSLEGSLQCKQFKRL
jgi:hypothetical protein